MRSGINARPTKLKTMQNTKNQARSSGIHARHNPTNDKPLSDDLVF